VKTKALVLINTSAFMLKDNHFLNIHLNRVTS